MPIKKVVLAAGILLISVFVSLPTASAAVATYTVDCNDVIKEFDDRILGVGTEWTGPYSFMNSMTGTELNPNYINFMRESQLPISSYRIGGASSRSFHFKDGVGKLNERANGRNYGLAEYIKSTLLINPDVQFIICLNIEGDTPQDQADMVRFLMLMPDDPNAVGSDGVNWAQKRIESGLAEPVTNVIFELGNEVDYVDGGANAITVQEYIALCKEIMVQMRSVVSDLEFSVQCVTQFSETGEEDASENPTAPIWNYEVLSNLCVGNGAFIPANYATRHVYYGGYSIEKAMRVRIDEIVDILKELGIDDRVRLMITEHAKWRSYTTSDHKMATSSLHGMLWTAGFITACVNSPNIEIANYFMLMGVDEPVTYSPILNWRVVHDYGDSNFLLSGIGNLYCLLKKNSEGDVLKSSVAFETPNINDNELFGYATRMNNGDLSIVLANINDSATYYNDYGNDHIVNLSFLNANHQMYLKKKITLTADNLLAYNTPVNTNAFDIVETVPKTKEEISQISLPAYSITILHFGEELYNETIDDVTVTNEVSGTNGKAVMNQKGMVNATASFSKGYQWGNCSAVILKKGVSAEQYQKSPNINNVIALTQFIGQYPKSSFEIKMPADADNGRYTLLVTANGKNGARTTFEKQFFFDNTFATASPIKRIAIDNPALQSYIPTVEQRTINVSVELKDSLHEGRMFTFMVVEGNREYDNLSENDNIVHIGQAVSAQNGSLAYSFRMPKNAASKFYTLFVSYQAHDGEAVPAERSVFIYQNLEPDYPLKISDIKGDNAQIASIESIKTISELNIQIENITDTDYVGDLYLVYFNKNGGLCHISVLDERLFLPGENEIIINVSDTIDFDISKIKILVWNKEMKCLTEFFAIE